MKAIGSGNLVTVSTVTIGSIGNMESQTMLQMGRTVPQWIVGRKLVTLTANPIGWLFVSKSVQTVVFKRMGGKRSRSTAKPDAKEVLLAKITAAASLTRRSAMDPMAALMGAMRKQRCAMPTVKMLMRCLPAIITSVLQKVSHMGWSKWHKWAQIGTDSTYGTDARDGTY